MFEDLDVLVSVATALVPKTPLFFLGPTNWVFVWAQGQKEKRYCWAHKRKAVFLGTQKREKVFDPRAAKLLRQPGVARSSQEQPGAARSSEEQPGAARSTQSSQEHPEQPGAAGLPG